MTVLIRVRVVWKNSFEDLIYQWSLSIESNNVTCSDISDGRRRKRNIPLFTYRLCSKLSWFWRAADHHCRPKFSYKTILLMIVCFIITLLLVIVIIENNDCSYWLQPSTRKIPLRKQNVGVDPIATTQPCIAFTKQEYAVNVYRTRTGHPQK